jgi:hypothetical protein
MNKSDLTAVPEFYQVYLNALPEISTDAVLHYSLEQLTQKQQEKLAIIGDEVYEVGKWQVPVILQHLIDTERIMAYRALRFARRDTTPLPGFDQDQYAANTLDTNRGVTTLVEELKLVRVSSIYLFDSFDEETLRLTGTANGKEISVAALAYIIAGHQAHHLRVIEERYLPLARTPLSPF